MRGIGQGKKKKKKKKSSLISGPRGWSRVRRIWHYHALLYQLLISYSLIPSCPPRARNLMRQIQRWYAEYSSVPGAYRSEGSVQYLAGRLASRWRKLASQMLGTHGEDLWGSSSGPLLRVQCHLRRRPSDISTPMRGPHWLSAKSWSPRRLGQGGPMEERAKTRPSSWDAHAESPA